MKKHLHLLWTFLGATVIGPLIFIPLVWIESNNVKKGLQKSFGSDELSSRVFVSIAGICAWITLITGYLYGF